MTDLNALINDDLSAAHPDENANIDQIADENPELQDVANTMASKPDGYEVSASDAYPHVEFVDENQYQAPMKVAQESLDSIKTKFDAYGVLKSERGISKTSVRLADTAFKGIVLEHIVFESFTETPTQVNYDPVMKITEKDMNEEGRRVRDILIDFIEKVDTDVRALYEYLSTEGIEDLQQTASELANYFRSPHMSIAESKNAIIDVGGEFVNLQSVPVVELKNKDLTASELLYASQVNNIIESLLVSINPSLLLFIIQTLKHVSISTSGSDLEASVEEIGNTLTLVQLEEFFQSPELPENIAGLIDILKIARQKIEDMQELLNSSFSSFQEMFQTIQDKTPIIYEAIASLRYVFFVSEGLKKLMETFVALEGALNPLL